MPQSIARALLLGSAALLCASAFAQTSPVVLTFSTTGDSRQDPNTYDKASVGATLTGQDKIWLQNTKAFARILRTIQTQKSNMLFFNGDMIHGYGRAGFGYTTNLAQTLTTGPVAPATTADIVGGDLLTTYQQYAYWRGMVAPVMETGTYIFPVAGNHETQCKACGPGNSKAAQIENEAAWGANMGDLIIDATRFAATVGVAPSNINYGPASGGPDGLTTDQSKLSYSFDVVLSPSLTVHFAVINTDPVGADAKAPTNWLAADLSAAKGRGAKKLFVFGHKPAYTYNYTNNATIAAAGLDAAPGSIATRDAFWNVIESNGATYFCGHEHVYNISRPLGGAYQVLVGTAGSPFDAKTGPAGVNTRAVTDRSYTWATMKLHADGSLDVLGYGFDENFGPTKLLDQFLLP